MLTADPIMQDLWQVKDELAQRYNADPQRYMQELRQAQSDFLAQHPSVKVLGYTPKADQPAGMTHSE